MILYVTTQDIDQKKHGIAAKMRQQVRSLSEMFGAVDTAYLSGKQARLRAGEFDSHIAVLNDALIFFYFVALLKRRSKDYRFAYIRNPYIGAPSFFILLLYLKFKGIRVILDIPSYPYDREARSLKYKLVLLFQRLHRPFYRYLLNLICYTGPCLDNIWGVKACRIFNACDPDILGLVDTAIDDDCIKFIGVADVNYWHGYDRFIRSIYSLIEDNSRANICFYIVSNDNRDIEKLKKLVTDLKLDGVVKFFSSRSPEELDELFAGKVIGVDAVGRFRSGSTYNDSIKSKEYTFRGVPFIKSHVDDSFQDVDFVYTVPHDESLINLQEVIDWYRSREFDPETIRSYALQHFQWCVQYSKCLADF